MPKQKVNQTHNLFNPANSTFMHIDLNSCFATIEQQANPLLRGKPIAVAAYETDRGCILAPSIEAKRYGIKTGMRVYEGKQLCPQLLVMTPDPNKYRFVNQKLTHLLQQYTPRISVRSIDEMILDFSPFMINKDALITIQRQSKQLAVKLTDIAQEIKLRIKSEIGDWLTVSIGISTNPYLAKVAAGLNKPDGLDEINQDNIRQILSQMTLVDLPYIKSRNQIRLNRVGIYTPLDFYLASSQQLKAAFQSINAYYWQRRLHGFLIDDIEGQRKSIGHSYALPKFTNHKPYLEKLLCKLVEKMGRRLRKNQLTCQSIHLACNFTHGFWHKGTKLPQPIYSNNDLFYQAKNLLYQAPNQPVTLLAVSCYLLQKNVYTQTTLFQDEISKRNLTLALDKINDRWGEFTIYPGLMTNMQDKILDRISFGGIRDMTQVNTAID